MHYRRIIVKLGTSTLTAGTKRLSLPHLVSLVQQIAEIHADGSQVMLVSSGAIATGREELNHPDLPRHVPVKQMLAAVGQPRLMALYHQLFQIYDITVAQVLLTRADLSDRRRYLNARNTLEALLAHKLLPVINENDTVATDEIKFGDNDTLSALVANLIEADLLLFLTDQQGLYTGDPRSDPGARLVESIRTAEIPEELWRAAGGSQSGLGTGGMFTKLKAADLARRTGTTVVIARGNTPNVLVQAAHGEPVGTLFTPLLTTIESRKRYILAGMKSTGKLQIDEGAAGALAGGSSLLPVGVVGVWGSFERGDSVRVLDHNGKEIALGLVNYSAKDLAAICKRQSGEIEQVLGYTYGDEVIHRNNLLML